MEERTQNFWGLSGDPVKDAKRKRQIALEIGEDYFDYDQYESLEKDEDYWDYIDQEVHSINAK